jgi:stringent starvation protein B
MTSPLSPESQGTPTRPYLVRALHEWCTDNGFTPYLAVFVDGSVQVPMEYVKNQEIVLNVGFDATSGLQMGNEFIEFKARFGGVARDIVVPVDHVVAIYARENGQGMAFPAPKTGPASAEAAVYEDDEQDAQPAVVGPRPVASVIPLIKPESSRPGAASGQTPAEPDDPTKPPTGGRPALKRVK